MKTMIKRSVKRIYLSLLIVLLSTLLFARADLPVHCKREQIEGTWTFRIEKLTFQPNLQDIKTTCNHSFPNKVEKTIGDINYHFEKFDEIEVKLGADYKVYDVKTNKIEGQWTPVYDEAFIVNYKNSVYTAFMKYYKDLINADDKFASNCDKTMMGWYIPNSNNNDKDWSCFYGFKSNIKHEFSLVPKFMQLRSTIMASNFIEMSLKTKLKTELQKTRYDQGEIVNELNSFKLPWTAHVHEEFKDLSFVELKEKLGLRRDKPLVTPNLSMNFGNNFFSNNQPILMQTHLSEIVVNNTRNTSNVTTNPAINITISIASQTEAQPETKSETKVEADSKNVKDYDIVSKYIDKELDEIDINQLPKNWDWRDVGGVNYVPKPRRQANCGSCYIFSTVSSLESRLRILTNNKDQTEFSRQFPLSCSFYTEGCEGGYPILVSKFFNEFEIIPETCFAYNTEKQECSGMCDYTKHPKKYFVSRYEYLGGFYGALNEINLIKEIRARGPIPGNMSVPWSFSYYKNGIYSSSSLKKNSGQFSKTSLFDNNISWSSVDHSILLVGYGEENGTKYWIGMNTWGENWGEKGYFRILRGENECNIETMGDAARISFKNR